MAFLYRKESDGIVITGCEGNVSWLQIPEEIEGLPVRGVEGSAFARRRDLLYAQLPQSLRSLGRFAFFGCTSLEKVVLGGQIKDYGDGVFRQCQGLKEFSLDLSGGDCTILREILADRDTALRVQARLPGGEVCLHFPDYLVDFEEDTHARVLHTRIEGAGFAYRECVSRKGIDLRAYDGTFPRVKDTEPVMAVQIALDRLCFPWSLEGSAEEHYRAFLREKAEEAVKQAVSCRREEWLRLLLEQDLMSPLAREAGLRLARDAGAVGFVSLLMHHAPRTGARFSL